MLGKDARHRCNRLSSEDPQTQSENARILRGIDQVMAATQNRGILAMDRGGDRRNLLLPWIDQERRFVIRLKGDRHLILPDGIRIEARQLAEHLLHEAPGRRISWQKVFLPEKPGHPLWLVVRSFAGTDRPMMLLSSLCAQDRITADNILICYRRRWKCEELARLARTALGMERFCLRTYEAFGRLILILTVALGFLSWMELRQPELMRWLCAGHPGQHAIKFGYYRLIDWLQRQIRPPVA